MKIVETEGLPVKLWLDDIEDGALEQAKNLAILPFAFHHIAIMPDAHQGYGMPIGGVLATEDVIIPNAVGVDIGCGMVAVKSSLHVQDLTVEKIKQILSGIRDVIPVGFKSHAESRSKYYLPPIDKATPFLREQLEKAGRQIGTLGGGNHFIEIQRGDDGFIWFMDHSGSRNLGHTVAGHYDKIAKKLNKRWHTLVPANQGLAFLPTDDEVAHLYLNDMKYCVDFAKANRALMINRIIEVVLDIDGGVMFEGLIDVPHNYVELEHHFERNVWVHRKGAIRARAGRTGIIPGSQGTSSYIVSGLGNPDSFMSCSHGAGRTMSRRKARKDLDLQLEIKKLDDQGIIHSLSDIKDLDEAISAYKDITKVMENQKDLVKIKVELKPIAVIKG